MIAIGVGVIAIFIVIRNASAKAAAANAESSTATQDQTNAVPTITDTGSYPMDMTGGVSGTGMDQTLSTYLAIADQNTSVQMGAVANQLNSIQSQMNVNNKALQDQITAQNGKSTSAAIAAAPAQPIITSTPAATSHPAPSSYSYTVKKGDTLSAIAVKQYGSKKAAYGGGIASITKASHLSNPNVLKTGQVITVPFKMG
jgi:LysM repeat protein